MQMAIRWYSDEVMSRNMGLFAKELAVGTPANE
jgi:hypothetical protein